MFVYVISGLLVASDLALPGLIEAGLDAGPSEVTIRAGAVPAHLPGSRARGPNWQIAGDQMLIAVPGIVRMLLREGRTIVYEPAAGTTPEEAAIFLSGTGFGILLHQRGWIVLHASAVRVGGAAVLFCGPSGAGKSTLAAALVKAGHALLADDLSGIAITAAGVPLVHPDGRRLKLWQNAIDRLDLAASRATRVRTQIEKYYVDPRGATPPALPVAAIYVLREARRADATGIRHVNLVDAAMLVRANAFRPAMVPRMGQAAAYFQATAALAQTAQVYMLTREMNFASLPSVLERLEAHWHDLSLTEMAA